MQEWSEYVSVSLEAEEVTHLPESVLFRINKRDLKGRPFGTPRNRRTPTIEDFNPRTVQVKVGDLSEVIVARRHGILRDQAQQISQLSNDELVQFRLEDPISGTWQKGISLTGGHHRTAEIILRVQNGKMDPDRLVRILIHD